ncbi:Acg family FMN-binding oxidoreductase [Roseibium sediminis]|uniref:Acg family FMN-binding oxidoreductase n=1 Tax=Roseibium sediminis TaxID=1775174 RepID=UPI00123CA948|nr:twin-arginine translocation pathway signal protein [Roseibium sediminis]
MSLSRRKMLFVLGGGAILAAGAGIGSFTATRTPKTALAPWDQAGAETEPRRKALSYAILAPNPHNRQPWLVDLNTPDTVILYRDTTRDLPHTDPYHRQLTIGLGCFLELMIIAAAQDGYRVDLNLYPQGETGPVSVAKFSKGAEADPLFAQIMHRRTCKEPFASTPVPADKIAALSSLARVITEEQQVSAVKKLAWAAHEVEMQTPNTLKESVDLMRMGKAEINANPDGIDLGGPFLESLMLVGMLTREAQLDTTSSAFQEGMRIYHEIHENTPAYAVVTTKGNTRQDQIEAGRRWIRLNLTTTELGLALHPVSQALQEYPEMADHYKAVHELLTEPGHTVQMLGRLGYGPQRAPSPRWPLETRIVNA